MQIISYFFRTIYDIGFLRTYGRIKYEIKKIFFYFLPGRLNLIISNCHGNTPQYKKILTNLKSQTLILKKQKFNKNKLKFNFLNEEKVLYFPINWHSNEFSHLWRFNLHYFDWGRELLEKCIAKNKSNYEDISLLNYFIEDWIDKNIPVMETDGIAILFL